MFCRTFYFVQPFSMTAIENFNNKSLKYPASFTATKTFGQPWSSATNERFYEATVSPENGLSCHKFRRLSHDEEVAQQKWASIDWEPPRPMSSPYCTLKGSFRLGSGRPINDQKSSAS